MPKPTPPRQVVRQQAKSETEGVSGPKKNRKPKMVTVTLKQAPVTSLPVYVHGVGQFTLEIDTPQEVPDEILPTLDAAHGVKYEVSK